MLRRLTLLPLAVVLLSPASAPRPHPISGPTAFVLLVNNHLVAVRATTGAIISDHILAPAPVPRPLAFRGYYLALSKDRKSLYALVLGQSQARDYLVVVDVATTRVEKWYALARGIVFLSVAVGPVSGRIYLFGNRAGDVVVTVLDPRTGSALSTRVVRRGHGVDWRIYRGLVWSNERELFINYWRGEAGGIDAVSLPKAQLHGCRTVQDVGCFWSEGLNIEQYGRWLVVESQTARHAFIELNSSGSLSKTVSIHMTGSPHTGDWDIDPTTGRLYEVGSCGYTGGLAVLDVNTGSSGMLAPLGTPGAGQPVTENNDRSVCGERISAGSQSLVVIGKTVYVWPHLQNKAILLIMNGRTGKILHWVRMSTDPMDLIAS